MNKLSFLNLLAAAALIGIATENAGSEEATPGVSAAPAGQTTAPDTGYVPGRYPPPANRGGYAQPWQPPSEWPAPPPGYKQTPPYYPPYGQYQVAPAAPAEPPLSTTLKETQKQLASKTSELDTTRAQLVELQGKLQAATAALHKAQRDTINAGVQVDTTRAQVDTLRKILCELANRLEIRRTALQNAQPAPGAAPDEADNAAAGEIDSEATAQAEPETDLQCSQTTHPPAITSGQRAKTVINPQAR
jgi:hypothetical protein